MLRAYAKYMRQGGTPFSAGLHRAGAARQRRHHPAAGAALRDAVRPGRGRTARPSAARRITEEIRGQLDEVASLDQDRILRSYLTLITATLRTNYFQPGRAPAPGPARRRTWRSSWTRGTCPELPAPRPQVRDLRLLAAGRGRAPAVRPGGARRAALVRPARGLPHRGARPGQGPDGEEHRHRARRRQGRLRLQAAARPGRPRGVAGRGLACYKTFIAAMLDVTDNIDGRRRSCRRRDVVRHDGDDPYLVVAADKGTATFSDIANGVARQLRLLAGRRVRLRRLGGLRPQGDGHHRPRRLGVGASGTSASSGMNPATDDFTVVGIGDMSGDVFGNGMLLSRAHPAGGRLRPPARLPRPRPRPGGQLRRAPAPVRAAPVLVGGLRPGADLRRRRGLAAHGEVGPGVTAGP